MKLFLCAPVVIGEIALEDTLREVVSAVGGELYTPRHSSDDQVAMQEMDGFVLTAPCEPAFVAYVLAFALLQERPVLFLYQRPDERDRFMLQLGQHAGSAQIITQELAPAELLASQMQSFVTDKVMPTLDTKDAPSIKFTLRITPRLDQLLTQHARSAGMSKADFLRKKMEDFFDQGDDG